MKAGLLLTLSDCVGFLDPSDHRYETVLGQLFEARGYLLEKLLKIQAE